MPPTAEETPLNPPLPPSTITEEPTALDRAIATRDQQAEAEGVFEKALREIRGEDSPADVNALIIADKELRRDLDAQLQKLKSLKASREHSLAVTKLQEAIMWLGMSLKSLNDTRPYPSSYDPTNTKVEPTADGLKL